LHRLDSGRARQVTRSRRTISPLALIVGVLVALLSIGAALVLGHSVTNQNQALLQNQAEQVTTLLQTALTQTGPQLQSIDTVAQATNDSPSAFSSQAGPLTAQRGTTIALVRLGKVVLVSGTGLKEGQSLPAPLASAVVSGHPQLFSPGVLIIGGQNVLTIVVGAGPAGTAVVEEHVINASVTTPAATGPYNHINIALYATPTAQPGQLIITTARPLPFSGSVAKTYVPVGSSKWLVVTSAKSSLAGTWSNAFPWILLVVGLLLAVLLGVLTDVLGRRERYAQQLVAERTEQLAKSQRELVRQERLSAVGEMATMIGHELRNPLGAAINGLYLVRYRLGDDVTPEIDKSLTLIERETNRAASLADDLTTYMREREPIVEHVGFGAAVDQLLEAVPPPENVYVSVENRPIIVDVDPSQLIQMLTNCVTNAYQAMPEGGQLHIAASETDGYVEMMLEDSGKGLDPKADGRAFDPFFTTKAQGTGLGLAIVQRIAEAHGGSVSIENGSPRGARVVIRLPRAETLETLQTLDTFETLETLETLETP
jgi:signal transduction histidine kinase